MKSSSSPKTLPIPFPAELLTTGWLLKIGDLHAPLQDVAPVEMAKVQCTEKEGNTYLRVWTGHPVLGKNFTVRECWVRHEDGRWAGTIGFEQNDSRLHVEEIHFPVIRMPFPETGIRLLVGVTQGWVFHFDRSRADGTLISGPFGSLRMSAALMEGRLLYLDCRDTRCHLQDYLWIKQGNELEYHTIHRMPCAPGNRRSGALAMENSLAILSGGWYEAAQQYRAWAITTSHYKRRIRKNAQRNIGCWLWNRGGADHVIPPVEQLARDSGIPVALDWYWWHHNAYDTNYPEFWPPREGVDKFRNAIARLNRRGIYVQVYVNGLTWDVDLPSYARGGLDSAVIKRDGSPYAIEFNCYAHHKLGYMCGEGTAFQKKILELVDHLVDAGLPGIYLDMIGCAALEPCYNPRHHHAPGGGNYQARGFRRFIREIRRRHPRLQLSTENCNETFMDLFESGIVLASSLERCCNEIWIDCVPAFSAVYHGATTLFGNFDHLDGVPPWDPLWPPFDRWKHERDWHAECPDQFAFELARTVIWGMQPSVCNLTMDQIRDPRFAEDYNWLVNLAKFYYENRPWLYDGRMLSPDGFQCPEKEVKFLQRTLFTTEEKMNILHRTRPVVLHSAWEAPDGRKALILINYTHDEQHCSWHGNPYTLPPRTLRRIDWNA